MNTAPCSSAPIATVVPFRRREVSIRSVETSAHLMPSGPADRVLTADTVAARLFVSTRTVRRMCDRGELTGGKVAGNWRILESEFQRYFQQVFKRRWDPTWRPM